MHLQDQKSRTGDCYGTEHEGGDDGSVAGCEETKRAEENAEPKGHYHQEQQRDRITQLRNS